MEILYSMQTEHSIRKAAKQYPGAARVLKELFPQAFLIAEDTFMVGDIVSADRSKQNCGKTGGGLGIVKVINNSMRLSLGVEFFDHMNGHTLDDNRATDGHGWWHAKEEVTLVFRPRKIKEK